MPQMITFQDKLDMFRGVKRYNTISATVGDRTNRDPNGSTAETISRATVAVNELRKKRSGR